MATKKMLTEDSAAAQAQDSGSVLGGALSATYATPATVTTAVAPKLDATAALASYAPQVGGVALPAWAGARTKQWNRSLALYNPNSPTLRTIRQKVAAARAGTTACHIMAAGDSKTFGSDTPVISTSSYPSQLSHLLGASEGIVYANLGDSRWSANTGFTQVAPTNQNWISAPGGSAATITFTTTEATTALTIYGYSSPGGSVSVSVDGAAATTWTIPGGSTWKKHELIGLSNTAHTVTISASIALTLLGIGHGYSDTRLTISNAGRPSSNAADWENINWSTVFGSSFGTGNANIPIPDMALFNIGTNTGTSTITDIGDAITAINAVAPTLIVAFGGIAEGSYNTKRAKLYDMADSLNLPLIDLSAVIGSYDTALARGFMGSTVHENAAGYAAEAEAIARVLRG